MIHRGHSPDKFLRSVKNGAYTYDQVWLFYKSAQKNEQDEYKRTIYALRIATQADAKGFKKYMRDLEITEIAKENYNKPVTKQSLKMLSGALGGKK